MRQGQSRLLRHLVAIAVLPFTVSVLVPAWIARRHSISPALGGSVPRIALQLVGLAFLAVGLLLFLASLRRFAAEGKGTLAPWDPPRALVVRGPYRFVRNPMISGVLFVLVAESLILVSLPHGVWAGAFLFLNLVYIPLFEEPQLERRFGESYREYRRHVGRFLPRLRPWDPGAPPRQHGSMEILERLQDRVPDTGRLQRIVLFDRDTGARHVSAVLVRLPAGHQFSLHTHPGSEDCFFVLSGSGEALEPGGRHAIAAPAGVWIPMGHPHGLRAGAGGMLEVGFQSPADHTAVPFEAAADATRSRALVIASFPSAPSPGAPPGSWAAAFPERSAWRHLDAQVSLLESGQRLTIGFPDFECAVVVASGEIELTDPVVRRLPAFSAVRLDPGCSVALRATVAPARLIAVKARADQRR